MLFFLIGGRIGHDYEQQVAQMFEQIVKLQDAAALGCPHITDSQHSGQVAPSFACCRISDDVRCAIGKNQPGTSQNPQIRFTGRCLCFA